MNAYANLLTSFKKTKTFEKAVQGSSQKVQGIYEKQGGRTSHLSQIETLVNEHRPITLTENLVGILQTESLKIYYLFLGTHIRSTIYSSTHLHQDTSKVPTNAPPKAFAYKYLVSPRKSLILPLVEAVITLGATSGK